MMNDEPDYKRVMLAIFLAAIVLIGWQIRVEWPRRQNLAHYNVEHVKEVQKEQARVAQDGASKSAEGEGNPNLARAQRIAAVPRIVIDSGRLHGSIALKGARFD